MIKKILFAIILLGLTLRFSHFKDVTFAYDMGRDAIIAMEIFTRDPIKLHGPRTDYEKVYHGPLYWYLIAPMYYFSGGNPYVAKFFLLMINLSCVPLIFIFAKKIGFDNKIALTSAFIFAVSYEMIQFGRWMSNPAPALATSLLSLIFFVDFVKNNTQPKKLALAIFFWGLSVQLQLFLLYQLVLFIILWLWLSKNKLPKLSTKGIAFCLLAFVLAFLPFILAEIKFGFESTQALFTKLTSNQGGITLHEKLSRWQVRYTKNYFFSVAGISMEFAKITAILASLFLLIKTKLTTTFGWKVLFVWTFGTLLVHMFNGVDGQVVMLGSHSTLYILFAYILVTFLPRPLFYITCFLILILNIKKLEINKFGEPFFMPQNMSLLQDQLKIIDYTYTQAEGKPFAFNVISSPLFTNNMWAYLYDWYGKKKYGYMPTWVGEPQVNVFSSNIAWSDQKSQLYFLIREPGPGIPQEYICGITRFENLRSQKLNSFDIGAHQVQLRKITDLDYKYNSVSVVDYVKYKVLRHDCQIPD